MTVQIGDTVPDFTAETTPSATILCFLGYWTNLLTWSTIQSTTLSCNNSLLGWDVSLLRFSPPPAIPSHHASSWSNTASMQ